MWLFRAKKDEDYAKVLETLEEELTEAKKDLATIKMRKQSFNTTWVVYSGVTWVVFTAGFWYYGTSRSLSSAKYTVCMSISILGPLIIFYSNKLLSSIFNISIKRNEKKIKQLEVQQKEKIKELKDKTKFDTTRKLIEKYDSPVSRASSANQTPRPIQRNQNLKQNLHPSMQPKPVKVTPDIVPTRMGPTGVVEVTRNDNNSKSKVWLESFVDKIVGADELEDTRYALICSRCYSHNGLVQKEEISTVQYICPKCGFFNKSKKSISKDSISCINLEPTKEVTQKNETSAQGNPNVEPTNTSSVGEGKEKENNKMKDAEVKVQSEAKDETIDESVSEPTLGPGPEPEPNTAPNTLSEKSIKKKSSKKST